MTRALGRFVTGLMLAGAPLLVAAAPPAGATTTVCVEIVVDYGRLAGSGAPTAPSATCVTLPAGATGSDVLAARARKLGRPAPRWQDGMLCAIDGYPRTGCADSDPSGGYDYWSYWHAVDDGAWSYSSKGAGFYNIPNDGRHHAEGWAWVQGGAEGSRQPAHVRYATVCPTTTPTPTPKSRPAPAATSAAPAATTAAPRFGATTSASARPSPTRSSGVPTATGAAPSTTASASPAATTAEPPHRSGGSLPVAPVLGGAVVVGLAAATALRFRRGR